VGRVGGRGEVDERISHLYCNDIKKQCLDGFLQKATLFSAILLNKIQKFKNSHSSRYMYLNLSLTLVFCVMVQGRLRIVLYCICIVQIKLTKRPTK
jgi:hypothetical protein